MIVYPPVVTIIDAPAFGTVLIGVEHDNEIARGGHLRLSVDALALLPEAITKAIAARAEGSR